MTFLQRLLIEIDKKNSWGKNELKELILTTLAVYVKVEVDNG